MYLFLAVLGLCCCAQAFSSCVEQGLLSGRHGLFTRAASLIAEHGLQGARVSVVAGHELIDCGAQA